MPEIQQYFGHFAPIVRSLALREPKGSRRQIIFFIGLFQHLEDLKLLYKWVDFQEEPADDLTLVPSFVPPLRGRLTMTCFTRVGILEDMIDLFGGIRFRYMDLFSVHGMRLLLDVCADTLETLRFYPNDPRGELLSLRGLKILANDFTVESYPQDFDLSRNKSLRTLEVTARDATLYKVSNLTYTLSTIASPVFTEVIIFYRDYDIWGVYDPQPGAPPTFLWLTPSHNMDAVELYRIQFRVFQEMQKTRPFKLVLCADVWHYLVDHAVGELERALVVEKAEGGFGELFSDPLVTYSPRRSRHAPREPWGHIVTARGYAMSQAPL